MKPGVALEQTRDVARAPPPTPIIINNWRDPDEGRRPRHTSSHSYYDDDERDIRDPRSRVRYRSDDADSIVRIERQRTIYEDGEISESDELDDDELYEFIPSSMSQTSRSKAREPSVDSSTPFLPPRTGQALTSAVVTMHVTESQYSGEACLDGMHGVDLTLLHEPKQMQKVLFRWM